MQGKLKRRESQSDKSSEKGSSKKVSLPTSDCGCFNASISPTFLCLLMNDAACIARILWILNCYYGPAEDGYVISKGFTRGTLKFGQVMMCSEVFLIVISWGAFVDAVKKLKALSNSNNLKVRAVIFIFILVGVCLPVEMYSIYSGNNTIAKYGEYLQVLILVGLIIAGVFYSCKINNLLSSGIKSAAKVDSLRNIRFTSVSITFIGLGLIVVFVCYSFVPYSSPWIFLLTFKIPFHAGLL